MHVEACCRGAAAGSIRLLSSGSAAAAWTEHLRASTCLLQPPPAAGQPHVAGTGAGSVVSSAAGRLAMTFAASTAPHQQQQPKTEGGLAGVTARIALGSLAGGIGYRVHPAAADAALHTGAVNPAAPRDGRTRVPAALEALHISSTKGEKARVLDYGYLCQQKCVCLRPAHGRNKYICINPSLQPRAARSLFFHVPCVSYIC